MARRFGAVPLRLAVGSALALTGLALLAAPASAIGSKTTTTVSESSGAVTGAPVTFTAAVTHGATGVPTGTVVFTVTGADSTPFTCDAGDTATLQPNGSGPGSLATCSFAGGLQASDSSYQVTATYGGDGTFTGSNGAIAAPVGRGATSTTLMSSSNPTVTGQSVTFSATVAPTSPSTGSPTGSVTFAINGTGGGSVACDTTGDTVPLTSDAASCTVSAGLLAQYSPYSVSATYSGDANYKPSTGTVSQTVSKAAVTLGLTSSVATPLTGQSVSFTASVTSATPPGSGTPSGDVVFSVMGNNVLPGQPGYTETCAGGDTQPLSGGSATCAFPAGIPSNPITYTVTATLKDPNYKAASTASLIQPVNKAVTSTTVSGLPGSLVASQGFTFTVTIQTNAPGGGVPTGNLEWAVCNHNEATCSGLPGGTYILPKPTKKDIANNEQVVKYTVPGGMKPGFYSVNANFSGDSDYQSSQSSTGYILVNKVPTSLHIVLQRNPLEQGSNMVIRAAVISNSLASGSLGAPQGTVSFTITGVSGDTVNCDGGSNSIIISTTESNQGRAVCTVPAADISTADGPYEVQAQYSGDSNYDTVTGSQTVYVVNP
jgi:hypothetical protein